MKKLAYLLFIITFVSCNSSDLKKEFNCKDAGFSYLEKTTDIRSLFSVQLPKHWKTNLYYDNSQTSIYSADTTKSLTKTTLIDVTYIHNPINFDASFKTKLTNKQVELQLKNQTSKEIIFLDKPSYLEHSKGKKGKYSYQIVNVYSKINSDNFLLSKIEVYGDSLVNNRICNAIELLEKITVK